MIKIGLTGSIGSGKSSIARKANEELKITIFDADKTVHILYEKSDDLKNFMINLCGEGIVQNCIINRPLLKKIMQDPNQSDKWKQIETEVHKQVWNEFDRFADEQEQLGKEYIIADVPLLFEKGSENHFDYTINTYLPYDQQKIRAMARKVPKLTKEDFEHRYNTFMPNDKRNQRADYTINNSGEIAASILQLRAHMASMKDHNIERNHSEEFNESAVYVGSFDPITLGHVDVVKSAAKMPYKKLYVAIGENPAKTPMFNTKERLDMINREMDRDVRPLLHDDQEIIVTSYQGLTVDFMHSVKSSFCIRGIRGVKDLEEESNLAAVNKGLYADLLNEPDTAHFTQAFFATSDPDLRHVSSSFARAISKTDNDLSLLRYVSPDVAAKMIAKRNQPK